MSTVTNGHPDGRLLRITQIIGVGNLIPISRSAFYALIKKGVFPKPYKPSARTALWRLDELLAAIDALSARRGGVL
jgi:predicted DNA-binding transcriptional regulator AlpA